MKRVLFAVAALAIGYTVVGSFALSAAEHSLAAAAAAREAKTETAASK